MGHIHTSLAVLLAILPQIAGGSPMGANELAPPAQESPAPPASLPAEQRQTLNELLASLALGLQARTIELGEPLVAPGGPLAEHGLALATVARALFLAGREADADALLAKARVSPETEGWIELEKAWIAIQRDELDHARALLAAPPGGASPLRHSTYPVAWLLLARVQARSGRLDQAALLAGKFVELDPLHGEAPSAWHLLSREAVLRGDGESARRFLDRAEQLRKWHGVMQARRLQIRRSPEEPLPRLGLALGWMQMEAWSQAQIELEALLAMRPDYCRAFFHLGESRRMDGRDEAARSAYSQGIECDPADARSRFNRALLLARTPGRRAEALADLEVIVSGDSADDPLFIGAHLEFARLLRDDQQLEGSAAAYDRYRELGGTEDL